MLFGAVSTGMGQPVISVLMPVYNAVRFVADAIESVLAQTLKEFEFIIIDDGSTDGSTDLLRRFSGQDTRIRLVSRPNTGFVAALNEGLLLAHGRYVARMDADDISLPDRFAKQVAFLESHPDVAVVGGAIRFLTEDGLSTSGFNPPPSPASVRKALLHDSALAHPTVMMRREALAAVGNYRRAFLAAEDYDLWLRLSERYDLANLEDVVLHYRQHADQVSVRRVCHQVFSRLAAQVSASARRQTGKDPADGLTHIDFAALVAMGVPQSKIEAALLERISIQVSTLLSRGDADVAWAMIDEVKDILIRDGSRRGRAELSWVASRASLRHGQRWRGLALALDASCRDPGYLVRAIRSLGRRLMRRQ
jgi:hypothetical protein